MTSQAMTFILICAIIMTSLNGAVAFWVTRGHGLDFPLSLIVSPIILIGCFLISGPRILVERNVSVVLFKFLKG